VYDLPDGKGRAPAAPLPGPVSRLLFSHDGKGIVLALSQKGHTQFHLLDPQTMQHQPVAAPVVGEVNGMVLSPDQNRLVVLADGAAHVLGLPPASNGKQTLQVVRESQLLAVFAPDGKTLATTGGQKVIHLWDVETASERAVLPLAEPLRGNGIMAFSPDGRILAENCDGRLHFHDVGCVVGPAVPPAAVQPLP
jgi:WD40 repeat protein